MYRILGADGVMMASRFMATQECEVHDNIKQELVRRQEQDTALICKSIHLQGRALKNETVELYAKLWEYAGLQISFKLFNEVRIRNIKATTHNYIWR